MEDERKKYIDCLLADFSSLKEEIRRRSTLQRFVLVGFLTVLALTFKEANLGADDQLSPPIHITPWKIIEASNIVKQDKVISLATPLTNLTVSYWVIGLWISSSLALLFYIREHYEILGLGAVIKERIAEGAARELGVRWIDIFHSETNQDVANIDHLKSPKYIQFFWIVFFGLPVIFTLVSIIPSWEAFLSLIKSISIYDRAQSAKVTADSLNLLSLLVSIWWLYFPYKCFVLLWEHPGPPRCWHYLVNLKKKIWVR